jgi:preprotein translocase subunit SecA
MDYLREGIHLRGFAQIDPLVAYKNEGFTMFRELMNSIWEEFARVIFHIEVNIEPADLEPEPAPARPELTYAGGGPEQPSALDEASQAAMAPGGSAAPGVLPGGAAPAGAPVPDGAPAPAGGNGVSSENPATVVKSDRDKVGRNDPCWCGSGKKYKKCHGA